MPHISIDQVPPELREAAKRAAPKGTGLGYQIENKAKDKSARIDLYDSIGGWSGIEARDFVKDLNDLDVETIELHINSPGGDVFDGISIYNALLDHDATINVTVDGMAASAASFIAMAGDDITVNRAAQVMIHDASGLCWGNAADMERMSELLDRFSNEIAEIYADRAGGEISEWRDAMKDETWYSAQEAVDAGLADKTAKKKPKEDSKAKDSFDLSVFNYAGREHAPAPRIDTTDRKTRASVRSKQGQENHMPLTPEQLEKLGLPKNATEDEIDARLMALVENEADVEDDEPDDEETNDEESEDTDETSEEEESGEDDESDEESEGVEIPEGTVLVDKAQWQDLQNKLNRLVTNEAKREATDKAARKKDCITAALKAGKFKARDRKHYEDIYDSNEKAARNLIDALEANQVPVEEMGRGDGDADTVDPQDAYPAEWDNFIQVKEVQA